MVVTDAGYAMSGRDPWPCPSWERIGLAAPQVNGGCRARAPAVATEVLSFALLAGCQVPSCAPPAGMLCELLASDGRHVVGREAEFREQPFERSRGAECVHADDGPVTADIARPADRRCLLDSDARGDGVRQDLLAIGLVLLLEQLPGGHADDAHG